MNKIQKIAKKITATYGAWHRSNDPGDFEERAWQQDVNIQIPEDDLELDEFQINGQDMMQNGDKIFLMNSIKLDTRVQFDWSEPYGTSSQIMDIYDIEFADKNDLQFWSEKKQDYIKVDDDDELYINCTFIKPFKGTKKQLIQNIKQYFEDYNDFSDYIDLQTIKGYDYDPRNDMEPEDFPHYDD